MMRILDAYIGRVIASTTFITLMVFVSVSGIIKFVEQMGDVGRGNYELAHAALYVLYAVPRDIEIFFPMAALIGGLIGIGMLASNSELVVMQAAGLSKLTIVKSAMKTAVLLILVSMAVGEWLAPAGEASARELRAQAISGGSLISSKNGVWAKDGDYFVHITEVEDQGTLNKVQVYRFDESLKLESWLSADSATFADGAWQLSNVKDTKVTDRAVLEETYETLAWQSSLTPEKLGVVTVKPESLSVQGLVSYLEYLSQNEQDQSRYLLAFWRKLVQPLTVAVMLLVALSFIFGPLRSVSMGARIMMGVLTGLLFHITNQVFGSLSLVYQLPPIIGAVMPSILFVSVALFLMKRKA
ncbi:lipopolysaccharide ABC transporter permease LptG [Thalassotalea euphylliae]|uniref:Lipopolysaccharide ABC transporter permease LptG n=2 Tax=Thalassotalea euphylliae TaxID=1655234 RepID=A0A3E0U470_9GAMM|nr:LPS export ABC transporter permease LptG [Thalassotalea euphylliae]REL31791.1 lipopolysaccharide ABC transporter permease LptG [Thalassotalea euphylliae]